MNKEQSLFNKISAYHVIFLILILVFIWHGVLNHNFSCEDTILNIAYRQFVHVDLMHLLVNLYALYVFSRVETKIGAKNFIILIIALLVTSTIMEYSVSKFMDLGCSIGFSGILFGLLAWELVTGQAVDINLIAVIIFMAIQPSFTNRKASLSGHLIGAVSGTLVGLLWKRIDTV